MPDSEEKNVAADSPAVLPAQRSETASTELVPEPSRVSTGVLPVLVWLWGDSDRTRRAFWSVVGVIVTLGLVGVGMLWASHALGVNPGVVLGTGVGTMTLVPAGAVILAKVVAAKKDREK